MIILPSINKVENTHNAREKGVTGSSVEPFVDQVPRRFFVSGRAGNPKFNFFHIVKYEVFNQEIDVNFKKVEKSPGLGEKKRPGG